MSSSSHGLSVVSLVKIGLHQKVNQIRMEKLERMAEIKRNDSPTPTHRDVTESMMIEDLPPSYSSTMSQDVDETSTKESITSQPARTSSSDSFELSTRSSLQSTKLCMDTRLLSGKSKRPVNNNAWNQKVTRNISIYQRDQISLLCFCTSALGGIAALAFYCTSI